jgi:hypothetical protein
LCCLPRCRRAAPLLWKVEASTAMTAPTSMQLRDEDVAYLLTLLRNTPQPLTTQQLIDALRRHADRG